MGSSDMATILPFRSHDGSPTLAPTDVLNRALIVLTRSMPRYLVDARPWAPAGAESKLNVLRQIATDQESLGERMGETILDLGGSINMVAFPMEYTDLHDLSVDFIVREAIRFQKLDIADLERYVEMLRNCPVPRALVEEALGLAKGHLETLQEIAL